MKAPVSVEELQNRFRIVPELRKHWQRVGHAEALAALHMNKIGVNGKANGHKPNGLDYGGIAFDGFDLLGQPRGTSQVRLDAEVDGKYRNPPATAEHPRWLNSVPGKLSSKSVVVLSESVKSSYAIASSARRARVPNIRPGDINGLGGWRCRPAKDATETVPLPDFMLLRDVQEAVVAPDVNVWLPGRSDLMQQLTAFVNYLANTVQVPRVTVLRLEDPANKGVNGVDDYLEHYTDEEFWERYAQRQPLWQYAFPTAQEFDGEELQADLCIEHLVANRSITVLASPSENFKTSLACEWMRGLLAGKGLVHNYFEVQKGVKGVLYCCPDMSHEMLLKYARQFKLNTFRNFRMRTMKEGDILYPDDPLVIEAARAGNYIVLDTLNYFTEADDDNNPQQLNKFIVKCRTLIDRHHAAGVMVLAHPTKAGVMSVEINLTEWVSGTYAKIGNVDTVWCLKKIPMSDVDATPVSVYVTREKSRPFMGVPCKPFTLSLLDGKGSCLDRGEMPMALEPGTAELCELLPQKTKAGRPADPEKDAMVDFAVGWRAQHLKDTGKVATLAEVAAHINNQFHPLDAKKHIDKSKLSRWLAQRNAEATELQRYTAKMAKVKKKKEQAHVA